MVKVNFIQDEPIIIAALGAKVSQSSLEKGSIFDLYRKLKNRRKKAEKIVNQIVQKYQHFIFGDFCSWAVTLEDLSRFMTIYFWRNISAPNLIFGAGLEASLRVIKPERYHPILGGLGKKSLFLYQELIEKGIPEQDARYVLPEGVLTRMIFSAPPRYLLKVANQLEKSPLEESKTIGRKIKKIVNKKLKFACFEEQSYSSWPFWGGSKKPSFEKLDYRGDIFSLSLSLKVKGSLAMHAQLARQRQFLTIIEPLEQISKRAGFVVPPTFDKEAKTKYRSLAKEFIQKQKQLRKEKNPNFVYFLLLGQRASSNIYGHGAAILELSRSRSEGVAQWEIRNAVGIRITEKLLAYKKLKKEIGPRCFREKRCLEPQVFKTQKAQCPAFVKSGGRWKKTLRELLQVLKEDYSVFYLK